VQVARRRPDVKYDTRKQRGAALADLLNSTARS
jgi:hypothetical protein